jgi:DNA-binding LacI/PurR family transcriptional regulator
MDQQSPSSWATRGASRRPKRVTMDDVAAHVGVSRALVSLVFRDLPGASQDTRDRVLQAADELGYRPDNAARMLARHNSRVLGVMITIRNPFHADLVEAIYPQADQLDYDILLSATTPSRDEHHAIEALIANRCEALILLGPHDDRELLSAAADQIPVVVVGRRLPGSGVDAVHAHEANGVRQAIDHLAELGHREIVHVDGGTEPGSAERRSAYRRTMRRHGLDSQIRVLPGDHTEESGALAARTLLQEGSLPTAVFASNDRCAVGLLDVLGRAGVSVPDDISVVGYDDSTMAHLSYIDLTTVRQDVDATAEQAVLLAVQRLEEPQQPAQERVLEPKLVVRGTTGPPSRR